MSIASAYPATSCSSRLAKDLVPVPESSFSTSASVSLAPSMRVEEPALSIVAIRRRLVSLSGARVSMTFQRPLNSSIFGDEHEDLRRNNDVPDGVHYRDTQFHPILPNSHPKARTTQFHLHPTPSDSGSKLLTASFWRTLRFD